MKKPLNPPRLPRWLPATLALAAAALALAACGGEDSGNPEDELRVSTEEWEATDFSRHSVPLSEFQGGGPPKDGIPSIDDPEFV